MKPIALIYNGIWSQRAFAQNPRYAPFYQCVYIHDLLPGALDHFSAAVIPFQSNQQALAAKRSIFFHFLAQGKTLAIFGDTTPDFLPATWEDRPVNNYWWKTDPDKPPVTWTDNNHPIYSQLAPRHARWHNHGVYTNIPSSAKPLQRNEAGEIITWQTHQFGGCLFVSTKDPIVEHGIQQIRHLQHYNDALTAFLIPGWQPLAA